PALHDALPIWRCAAQRAPARGRLSCCPCADVFVLRIHSRTNMNPKRLIAAAAMAAALVLTACTTVQTTSPGAVGIDRTQRMSTLVSEAQMREEAMQAYRQIVQQQRQKGALNVDAALTGRVRAITARLIPASTAFRPEARSWSWEV